MVWDKTLPIEGALAPTYNDIMRADKTALEAALNAYMYFATGGVQTGQPRQGSARPYYQAAAPATRLDGDYFDSTDYGTPWIDLDNSKLYFLTSADGAGTDVWTLASTEIIATLLAVARVFASTLKSTGNFTVGANKLVVTAASGNTAIAGTLGVTGVATVAKGSLLASSDAPTTDAMIANKKYVDDLKNTKYAQGWAYCDTDGTVLASFNVSGVVRNDTGDYTVSWDTDFADANYCPVATSYPTATEVTTAVISSQAAGNTRVKVYKDFETAVTADAKFCIVAFGAQ